MPQDQVIILTRPAAQNARFAKELRAAGISNPVIDAPVTEIAPRRDVYETVGATGAIFTSMNGVHFGPDGAGRAWTVGNKTADVARARGWTVASAAGEAEALLQRICADLRDDTTVQDLVHYSGTETRGDLAERLSAAGIPTRRVAVYRQEPLDLSAPAKAALQDDLPPIFPVFSPNSAKRLVAQLPPELRADFVALSPAVAKEIPKALVRRLGVAEHPNAQSLLTALSEFV
ncbi:MAG: uroporphyrinogen-III synthase [Cognatishimia sp.]|uniref:uroporphyrinogen-III synthase n=1 Tax=Cognatishimia sp. TaxID=2211648 RepID=UPI0040598F97